MTNRRSSVRTLLSSCPESLELVEGPLENQPRLGSQKNLHPTFAAANVLLIILHVHRAGTAQTKFQALRRALEI